MSKPSALCLWQGSIENVSQNLGPNSCPFSRLDDIHLWSSSRHCLTRLSASYTLALHAARIVDPTQIPLWMVFGGPLRLTSGSNTTKQFFQTLAVNGTESDGTNENDKRILLKSLLVHVEATPRSSSSSLSHRVPEFFVFFIEMLSSRWTVSGLPLSTNQGVLQALNVKREDSCEPVFVKLPKLGNRAGSSASTPEIKQEPEINIQRANEVRNKLRVKQIVMSALRLHDLSRGNYPEIELLTQLVIKGTCLAHRKNMPSSQLDLDQVEDTVAKLLAIFLDTKPSGL